MKAKRLVKVVTGRAPLSLHGQDTPCHGENTAVENTHTQTHTRTRTRTHWHLPTKDLMPQSHHAQWTAPLSQTAWPLTPPTTGLPSPQDSAELA